jgi:hypothetical protein
VLSEDDLLALGEAVDRLLTVPMSIRVPVYRQRPFTLDLYEAARERTGRPLALKAAEELLRAVHPGDAVIFATGFVIPTWLRPETDGPVGAAALARTLAVARDVTPVFVIEDFMAEMMAATCHAAGLKPDSWPRARAVPLRTATLPFPLDVEQARREAVRMLDEVRPTALVAIERPSWNEKGVYHPGAGVDFSGMVAKVDCLFDEARARGILTVGIGDHGGEIGFGLIHETCKRVLPLGSRCRCPCQSGIAAATAADVLVVCAPPSNRGANGVQACLAALLGREELLHDSALERRLIQACTVAGAIDSTSGLAEPATDRVPLEANAALIDLLHEIIGPLLYVDIFKQKHSEMWVDKYDALQERVDRWRELL